RQGRDTRVRSVLRRLGGAPLATAEECAEIAATPNLVLRNLKITQMYHRLSLQLALLLGHQDANWCTFACNASKTAGYSIRGEEVPLYGLYLRARQQPRAERWLSAVEGRLQALGLARRFDQVIDAVSESISAGNLKVFAELGPLFARFVHT